jgi:hypothetical protein
VKTLLDDANAAYRRGDFANALRIWLRLKIFSQMVKKG